VIFYQIILPLTPFKNFPTLKKDGLVKSPSAALRCNFVVAAYLNVSFTPQFLRAQSRLGGKAFYETIGPALFAGSSKEDGEFFLRAYHILQDLCRFS
jgi:hypothetical protein